MPQFKAAGSVPIGIYPPFFLGRPLSLNRKQIKAHGHVIGKSGSGKSYFLASLYIALLQAGFSVTLIDPAGDLAKLILTHLVAMGYYNDPLFYNKVVYLDIPRAYRHQRYFPFNPLKQEGDPYTLSSNWLEALHRAWPSLGGGNAAAFDLLIKNGTKVVYSNDLPPIALFRFLVEKEFRDPLLAREPDQQIVSVFRDWYDRLPAKEQLDMSGSSLRRMQELIFNPILRYSLSQPSTLMDYKRILQENQSFLINLKIRAD